MRLLRPATLSALLLAATLSLSGCASALAASIKARLLNAGFTTGSVAGTLSKQAISEGALVSSFANGAALESFLVSAKGFARIQQPLVYVGSFFLS
jgi:hypothetical protein